MTLDIKKKALLQNQQFDPATPLGTYVADQGGYYIADVTYGDGRRFALFTPTAAVGRTTAARWRDTNSGTANSSDDWDGWANQQGQLLASAVSHECAAFCAGITFEGFSDWYFPARLELAAIRANRNVIVGTDALPTDATQNWSSTQNSTGAAGISIVFSTGSESNRAKNSTGQRTIAIRRTPIV